MKYLLILFLLPSLSFANGKITTDLMDCETVKLKKSCIVVCDGAYAGAVTKVESEDCE